MISLCILARDSPYVNKIIELFDCAAKPLGIEYEVCIGDNSSNLSYSDFYKEIADVYVRITDQELFRMGIPFAHNRIVAMANSYKIFYLDADEYPIWIHPKIEELYDKFIVPSCLRVDFCTFDEIAKLNKMLATNPKLERLKDFIKTKKATIQDRLYNSRYTKFEGVCHSIFWVPEGQRSRETAAILLHNKDVRRRGPANQIIYEQYARQNKNPFLASSDKVLSWGTEHKHKYKDWKEFVKNER